MLYTHQVFNCIKIYIIVQKILQPNSKKENCKELKIIEMILDCEEIQWDMQDETGKTIIHWVVIMNYIVALKLIIKLVRPDKLENLLNIYDHEKE
jgi:hypothetical protein